MLIVFTLIYVSGSNKLGSATAGEEGEEEEEARLLPESSSKGQGEKDKS